MRCFGLTTKLKRCKNNCKFIFCHNHKIQWWGVLVIIATLGGVYRDVLEPIFTIEEENEAIIKYAIATEETELAIKKYDPDSQLDFLLKHHIRNFSTYTFNNYQFTSYIFVFNENWKLDDYLEAKLENHENLIFQPGSDYTLNQNMISWKAKLQGIHTDKMIGIRIHEFRKINQLNHYKNVEYYNFIFDTIRNEASVGIPTQDVIDIIEEPIDSILKKEKNISIRKNRS